MNLCIARSKSALSSLSDSRLAISFLILSMSKSNLIWVRISSREGIFGGGRGSSAEPCTLLFEWSPVRLLTLDAIPETNLRIFSIYLWSSLLAWSTASVFFSFSFILFSKSMIYYCNFSLAWALLKSLTASMFIWGAPNASRRRPKLLILDSSSLSLVTPYLSLSY